MMKVVAFRLRRRRLYHRLFLLLLSSVAFSFYYDCGYGNQNNHHHEVLAADESATTTTTTTTGTDYSSSSSSTSKEDGSCTPTTSEAGGNVDTNHGECINPDISSTTNADDDATLQQQQQQQKTTIVTVTKEELAKHNGKDGADIWLSVLGEVYDVSTGEKYYGPGMGYGAFAGTDCSVCFVSGTFTEEEAERPLEDITDQNIGGVLDWKKFYETHETYTHVGRLVDPRFFDETGSPTPSMQQFAKRVIQYQIDAAEKKKERELKRKKRQEEREAAKKKKKTQQQEEMAKMSSRSKSKQPNAVPDIL